MRALMMTAAILCAALPAHAAGPQIVSQGPLIVAGAQSFVLRSERVGRDFLVTVTPPPIAIPLPGQRFGALIALDGGREITAPIGKMLVASAMMEPAVIVTVDYPPGQPNLRRIDLTHRPHEVEGRKQGGGGAAFQAFLTDELAPFLESRFAVGLDRSVLFGHSLGGLFTANVLAERPDAFGGYIVASPSVQWDESVVARVAAVASKGGGRRVLVAVGGKEPDYMVDGAKRIAAALSGPRSTWRTQHKVYAEGHHTTYYGALVLSDLPQLMPRIGGMPDQTGAIRLDPVSFTRYAGTYRLADGRTIAVKPGATALLGQLSGLPMAELTAQTPTRFFIRGVDAQVTFEDASSGPYKALLLRMNGGEARAVRVD